MRWWKALSAIVVGSFVPAMCQAGVATFTDGDFANWSFSSLAAPGSSAAMRVVSSGNPGLCLDVTTHSGPRAWGIGLDNDALWNPGSQGPIDQVQATLDVKSVTGWGAGQDINLFVEQGANRYAAPGVRYITGSSQSWHSFTLGPYTMVDFAQVLGSDHATWNRSSHPDFSASGSLLRFGFGTSNEASGTYTQLYDNWSLRINLAPPTPEPTTAALLAIVAVSLSVPYSWRRWRAAWRPGGTGKRG